MGCAWFVEYPGHTFDREDEGDQGPLLFDTFQEALVEFIKATAEQEDAKLIWSS